jgi:ankyrin repeat protein
LRNILLSGSTPKAIGQLVEVTRGHLAVSSKNKKAVELLVARGADVNARNLQGRAPLYGNGVV